MAIKQLNPEEVLAKARATSERASTLLASEIADETGFDVPEMKVSQEVLDAEANIQNGATSAMAGAASQEEFMKAQQERIDELTKQWEEAQKTQQSWTDKLKTAITGKTDITGAIKTEMEKYGVPETWDKIQALTPEIAALNTELAQLKTQEALAVEAISQRPGYSQAFATREGARISREYAIKQAGVSAELGAKTALMSAYQGNIATAQGLVQDTVKAMQYDDLQELQNIKDFMDINADLIDDLDDEQKDILTDIQTYWETKTKNDKADYTDKWNMVLDVATKGGTATLSAADVKRMTSDEVREWYAGAVKTIPAEAKTYAPPETLKEWEAAGGLEGTGMTFAQFLGARRDIEGLGVDTEAEFRTDYDAGMPLPSALELYGEDLGEDWIKSQYPTETGGAGIGGWFQQQFKEIGTGIKGLFGTTKTTTPPTTEETILEEIETAPMEEIPEDIITEAEKEEIKKTGEIPSWMKTLIGKPEDMPEWMKKLIYG